jgi:hypothetical protein
VRVLGGFVRVRDGSARHAKRRTRRRGTLLWLVLAKARRFHVPPARLAAGLLGPRSRSGPAAPAGRTLQRPGSGPRSWGSVVDSTVAPLRDAAQVAALLDSPEITGLITDLEATRWTGRPGYPVRAMMGLVLVKAFTRCRPGPGLFA